MTDIVLDGMKQPCRNRGLRSMQLSAHVSSTFPSERSIPLHLLSQSRHYYQRRTFSTAKTLPSSQPQPVPDPEHKSYVRLVKSRNNTDSAMKEIRALQYAAEQGGDGEAPATRQSSQNPRMIRNALRRAVLRAYQGVPEMSDEIELTPRQLEDIEKVRGVERRQRQKLAKIQSTLEQLKQGLRPTNSAKHAKIYGEKHSTPLTSMQRAQRDEYKGPLNDRNHESLMSTAFAQSNNVKMATLPPPTVTDIPETPKDSTLQGDMTYRAFDNIQKIALERALGASSLRSSPKVTAKERRLRYHDEVLKPAESRIIASGKASVAALALKKYERARAKTQGRRNETVRYVGFQDKSKPMDQQRRTYQTSARASSVDKDVDAARDAGYSQTDVETATALDKNTMFANQAYTAFSHAAANVDSSFRWFTEAQKEQLVDPSVARLRRQQIVLTAAEASMKEWENLAWRWRQEIWHIIVGLHNMEAAELQPRSIRREQLAKYMDDMIERRAKHQPRMRDDSVWGRIMKARSESIHFIFESEHISPKQQTLWKDVRKKLPGTMTSGSTLANTRDQIAKLSRRKQHEQLALLERRNMVLNLGPRYLTEWEDISRKLKFDLWLIATRTILTNKSLAENGYKRDNLVFNMQDIRAAMLRWRTFDVDSDHQQIYVSHWGVLRRRKLYILDEYLTSTPVSVNLAETSADETKHTEMLKAANEILYATQRQIQRWRGALLEIWTLSAKDNKIVYQTETRETLEAGFEAWKAHMTRVTKIRKVTHHIRARARHSLLSQLTRLHDQLRTELDLAAQIQDPAARRPELVTIEKKYDSRVNSLTGKIVSSRSDPVFENEDDNRASLAEEVDKMKETLIAAGIPREQLVEFGAELTWQPTFEVSESEPSPVVDSPGQKPTSGKPYGEDTLAGSSPARNTSDDNRPDSARSGPSATTRAHRAMDRDIKEFASFAGEATNARTGTKKLHRRVRQMLRSSLLGPASKTVNVPLKAKAKMRPTVAADEVAATMDRYPFAAQRDDFSRNSYSVLPHDVLEESSESRVPDQRNNYNKEYVKASVRTLNKLDKRSEEMPAKSRQSMHPLRTRTMPSKMHETSNEDTTPSFANMSNLQKCFDEDELSDLPHELSADDTPPRPSAAFTASHRLLAPLRRMPDVDEAAANTKRQTTDIQQLTHLTKTGEAHMVSVSEKADTKRVAVATGKVRFSHIHTYTLVTTAALKKGDVLAVSRIAGIQAAKLCPNIVPLCHPIIISSVKVDVKPFKRNQDCGIDIEARVECTGPTGVEMEALTAVMGSALTAIDMIKAVDKAAAITDVKVVYKSGGRSGTWLDEAWDTERKES